MATDRLLASEVVLHRFNVDEYQQMGETGIFDEDDPVELIDGKIVRMSPVGGRHVNCVARLTYLLVTHFGTSAVVHVQNPVRLSRHDEPEPDFTVVRVRDYGGELPEARDVLLLIEIADSSLRFDRGEKPRLYARAGVPEYWVVDLPGGAVECYAHPEGEAFREHVRVKPAQSVDSITMPGLVLAAGDILG